MEVLHVAPSGLTGANLREAMRIAGLHQEVLPFRDDLSCGPIAWGTPQERTAWWLRTDEPRLRQEFETFWHRLETADERLVVWFGRQAASELAFFLALADRLRGRTYDIVDVTQLQWPITQSDGSSALMPPAGAVLVVPPDQLAPLIGTARLLAADEAEDAALMWECLRRQNAPFRIVTPTGLTSAPIDHFDSSILRSAGKEWQNSVSIIARAMARIGPPYMQVGDVMLLRRLVALIEEGKLLADGDPWDMRTCLVRLPD
ncbi:protein of unknown function [Rhodospirillales bacterium URHD0017]|nr:protein of unknown function [Rhodospirillales bacterium URHD0017]